MDDLLNKIATTDAPVLIAGPTASGKSALGLALAERGPVRLINSDALQVYADWQVLTARPDANDCAVCPHRLYGHVSLRQPYSVGHWLREVERELSTAQAAGERAVILGGTGLYFRALTEGLVDIPEIPPEIRSQAEALATTHGKGFFAQELHSLDPATHSNIDINNPARTQRAWEVLRATGTGLAAWQAKTPPPLIPTTSATCLLLNTPTDWLNARIDQRLDQMVDVGALDECRAVMDMGWDPTLPSSQAIGAREFIAHLSGDMSLDAAIKAAKTQTHRYAKRQRTWFRARMKSWTHLHVDENGLRQI